jgi:hypothetical protein
MKIGFYERVFLSVSIFLRSLKGYIGFYANYIPITFAFCNSNSKTDDCEKPFSSKMKPIRI